jgi:hypothetical protein
MSPTRRDFIRSVGVAMATLMMGRCNPLPPTCYEPMEVTPFPTPTSAGDDSPQARLRHYWLGFGEFADRTREEWEDLEASERARETLISEHRATLDEMVAAGELEAGVADQVQLAFSEAMYHVWRSNVPITCYEPVLIDYTPTSAGQLVQQAGILAEMADGSSLDQETVERANAAIARDMAFLALPDAEVQALYERLIEAAGESYAYPSFDEVELDITPQAVEAARFLVESLLE